LFHAPDTWFGAFSVPLPMWLGFASCVPCPCAWMVWSVRPANVAWLRVCAPCQCGWLAGLCALSMWLACMFCAPSKCDLLVCYVRPVNVAGFCILCALRIRLACVFCAPYQWGLLVLCTLHMWLGCVFCTPCQCGLVVLSVSLANMTGLCVLWALPSLYLLIFVFIFHCRSPSKCIYSTSWMSSCGGDGISCIYHWLFPYSICIQCHLYVPFSWTAHR
jgi:hypothetical protein